jgi:hypothetical protein
MSGKGFYQFVTSHPYLRLLDSVFGETPAGDYVKIGCTKNNSVFALSPEAIRTADQETLEAVLLGERPPQIMKHVTRIVGYYSMLNNWNGSKLAELNDRHKGDYAVQ